MGMSMPKFITNGYNNIKDKCNDIREGWRATKLIFKMVRQLEMPKGSEPQNPEAFVDVLKNSDDLPEPFKKLLSSVDSDTLKAMLKVTMEAFSKNSEDQSEPDKVEKSPENETTVESENMGKTIGEPQATTSHENQRKENMNSTFSEKTGKEADEFIPSQTQKTIFNLANKEDEEESQNKNNNSKRDSFGTAKFRTAKEFQDFTKRSFEQNKTSEKEKDPINEKNLPPLTKYLAKELETKLGSDWKSKVPTFMKDPNSSPIPDLGLGLSKQGNKDMVVQMSNVLKDLM